MRQFLNPELYRRVQIRSRGYMPHWEVENATYTITYREIDSLPQHVIARLKEERSAIRRSICGTAQPTALQRSEIAEQFGLRLDAELDVGRGRCRLRELAPVAAENLKHFDGERYELIAWTVMPNHMHVVFTPHQPLADILHSWKSYVAHQAGGRLFAREYFDRIIRDERDLENTVAYVRSNPAKAGLREWPWVG
jgi:REP element-mobilizing transposase RayT